MRGYQVALRFNADVLAIVDDVQPQPLADVINQHSQLNLVPKLKTNLLIIITRRRKPPNPSEGSVPPHYTSGPAARQCILTTLPLPVRSHSLPA